MDKDRKYYGNKDKDICFWKYNYDTDLWETDCGYVEHYKKEDLLICPACNRKIEIPKELEIC